jgi:hypothetical protein
MMAASMGWLSKTGLPQLFAMICQIELHLVPVLLQSPYFGEFPRYYMYTTNLSHTIVEGALQKRMLGDYSRVKLINLDLDMENHNMASFTPGKKVDVNGTAHVLPALDVLSILCLRRDLADITYLPSDQPRLLLGTDVSFIRPGFGFVDAAAQLPDNKVLYIWDQINFDGHQYRLRSWPGPQCPGLLGDFYYLSPGKPLSYESFVNKTWWYLAQPAGSGYRFTPFFKDPYGPYHGIDQWVLSIFLGEWADPPEKGCYRLNSAYYRHWTVGENHCLEAVHDKNIRSAMCSYYHPTATV